MNKTSHSHPLRIDAIQPLSCIGSIGMSFCPGKTQPEAMSGGNWFRDLEIDLKEIQSWEANVVLTLLESHEIADLKVARLGTTVRDFGITWHWLEIKDGGIPEGAVVQQWASIKLDLISRLLAGERVFIHCKGGLGRTGTLATELLVSFGEDVTSAMQRIRLARPGAIETQEQEDYLHHLVNFERA